MEYLENARESTNLAKLAMANAIFYFSMIAFSIVVIPLFILMIACMTVILPQRYVMKRLRRAISWYGFGIISLLPLSSIRVSFKDFDQSTRNRSCIFVCNHRSSSDPYLMALLPAEIIQVVNVWPFKIPVLGAAAKLAGYLSVNEMPFEEFSRKVLELIQQGVSIAVFPEGTRSGGRAMGQFHGSIFRVALEARCPIVPVCIAGNEKIPPRGALMLHPGAIQVHKLPAIEWNEYNHLNPFKLKNSIRDIIARHLDHVEGRP